MTTIKKVLSGLFALALLATTAVGVAESKKSETTMSDLALANIEALAFNEGGGNVGEIPCYGTIRVEKNNPDTYEPLWTITLCNGCELVNCYQYMDKGLCTGGGFILI